MSSPEIRAFQFDDSNLAHLSNHQIDANLVIEVLSGVPVFAVNQPKQDRSGTHVMIGPTIDGRLWTIIVVPVDDALGIWRPITGWPSTPKEARYYATQETV